MHTHEYKPPPPDSDLEFFRKGGLEIRTCFFYLRIVITHFRKYLRKCFVRWRQLASCPALGILPDRLSDSAYRNGPTERAYLQLPHTPNGKRPCPGLVGWAYQSGSSDEAELRRSRSLPMNTRWEFILFGVKR